MIKAWAFLNYFEGCTWSDPKVYTYGNSHMDDTAKWTVMQLDTYLYTPVEKDKTYTMWLLKRCVHEESMEN